MAVHSQCAAYLCALPYAAACIDTIRTHRSRQLGQLCVADGTCSFISAREARYTWNDSLTFDSEKCKFTLSEDAC
jgi:hypothetical protein